MAIKKHDPNPYSSEYGEYIANFESKEEEVLAVLFEIDGDTKVYVYFPEGKEFYKPQYRFFSDIHQYLHENNYPKIRYIDRLNEEQWNELNSGI